MTFSNIVFGGLLPFITTGKVQSPNMTHRHLTITWLYKIKLTITISIKK